ncbi:hypothetical protein [Natrarchaeobaculum aegyptiacum]|uniref:Uncharacterized protein n=1 Tax=Natrarchaeobaculum aegyptiacum TaxID=745377 RepID=A0A2Z2HSA4_9EURY|nr:hypothetical protein [Natrarchaeobaculum aegyptiacum]ARS89673.1 hypothetical protein B1756_07915 [Natrarchaeobaculum aegyptiacum]
MTTFTPDDVDKTVETETGDVLGVVVEVEAETAYVDPEPDAIESTRAVLDWGQGDPQVVPLTDDAVAEIGDETIRLAADVPAESITSGAVEEGDAIESEGDRGTDDYEPGEPVASSPPEAERDADVPGETPPTGDPDPQAPLEDDEFSDAPEGGARVDPDDEMAASGEVGEQGTADEPFDADELDAIEDDASRGLEVDPSELTTDDEADIRAGEDVGNRTDGSMEPTGDEASEGPGSRGGSTTDDGSTPEDAGSIDAEIPGAPEQRPDHPDDFDSDEDEAGGEDPDSDLE